MMKSERQPNQLDSFVKDLDDLIAGRIKMRKPLREIQTVPARPKRWGKPKAQQDSSAPVPVASNSPQQTKRPSKKPSVKFLCPECKAKVKNLKTHLRKVHDWKQCPFCHAMFSPGSLFGRHLITKHPEPTERMMKKRGICPEYESDNLDSFHPGIIQVGRRRSSRPPPLS